MANAAISHILGGAVVNREFCSALLHNPMAAVSEFDLTLEEREAISSIRAASLEDFATQLYAWMVGQGNGYGSIKGHEEPSLSRLRPVVVYAWTGAMLS